MYKELKRAPLSPGCQAPARPARHSCAACPAQAAGAARAVLARPAASPPRRIARRPRRAAPVRLGAAEQCVAPMLDALLTRGWGRSGSVRRRRKGREAVYLDDGTPACE